MERNREMKITRKEEKPEEKVIPEVGDVWKHKKGSDVFMRVKDIHGSRALGLDEKDFFFSVGLEGGWIYSTGRNADDIVILQGSFVEE